MSDRFDDMAEAWFAGLRKLESEQRARRSLAEFLRKAVEAELDRDRQRMVAIVRRTLVGDACEHVTDGKLCGNPTDGVCRRQTGTPVSCLTALCDTCAALPDTLGGGAWLRLNDLARL